MGDKICPICEKLLKRVKFGSPVGWICNKCYLKDIDYSLYKDKVIFKKKCVVCGNGMSPHKQKYCSDACYRLKK